MEYSLEELLPIVKKLTEKYTRKESTSVTYEMAEQLMSAIFYCIEQNTLQQNVKTDIIDISNKEPAEAAYQRGYEQVLEKVRLAKKIYDKVIADFHSYGNQNYHDTIVKGMPSFFLFYDARFYPQNHILTLDYPLLKPLDKLCGINAIYEYLLCIQLEQFFLSAFTEDYIVKVLVQILRDYDELFINICQIVMRNVVCHMIIRKNIDTYNEPFLSIKEFVSKRTQEEIKSELFSLLQILVNNNYNHDENLLEYLCEDINDFSFELIHATKHDCLEHIFTTVA